MHHVGAWSIWHVISWWKPGAEFWQSSCHLHVASSFKWSVAAGTLWLLGFCSPDSKLLSHSMTQQCITHVAICWRWCLLVQVTRLCSPSACTAGPRPSLPWCSSLTGTYPCQQAQGTSSTWRWVGLQTHSGNRKESQWLWLKTCQPDCCTWCTASAAAEPVYTVHSMTHCRASSSVRAWNSVLLLLDQMFDSKHPVC